MPIVSNSKYIFLTTLLFFLFLWFVNPSNYVIAAAFFILIVIYNLKIKNIRLSLLLALLSSSIIYTGKSYLILLIPKGVLPIEIYPMGYYTSLTITANLILSVLMALVIIRDLINKNVRRFRLKSIDLIILLFYLWSIIADCFGSKDPMFSLLYNFQGLTIPVLFLFIRLQKFDKKHLRGLVISLLSALLIFESLISFQQLMTQAPLGRNLEAQKGIEYFGKTVDELQFTFRPVGTFNHANMLGLWISSYLIIFVALLVQKPSKSLVGIILIGTACLITTLSRSSWLGFVAGTLFVIYLLEKKKIINKQINKYLPIFITIFIPLVIIFILPRIEKSLYAFSEGGGYFRKVQIERSVPLLLRNPLWGVGSNRSVQEGLNLINKRNLNPSIILDVHNWYILNTIEHGFVSTFIFFILIYLYIKRYEYQHFDNTNDIGWLGGVIASLVVGIFQPFINIQIIILSLVFL